MGQKVNPVGMRIGLNKNWNSRWFASDKDFSDYLYQDISIRRYCDKKVPRDAYLSHVEIERKKTDKGTNVRIMIFVGRPGAVIGAEGATINSIKKDLQQLCGAKVELKVDVIDVKNPCLDARIEGEKICQQLEARASFRIVQKKALNEMRKAGAKGCKTSISGRLAGADIARSEGYKAGIMAINTLKSDIDFAISEAMTTYGKLGVKVWICRGEKNTYDEPSENDNKKPEGRTFRPRSNFNNNAKKGE
jgi:small subunit ribosomal protein S3